MNCPACHRLVQARHMTIFGLTNEDRVLVLATCPHCGAESQAFAQGFKVPAPVAEPKLSLKHLVMGSRYGRREV